MIFNINHKYVQTNQPTGPEVKVFSKNLLFLLTFPDLHYLIEKSIYTRKIV